VKIGIFTLVATQLMNLVFVGALRHAGLALAIGRRLQRFAVSLRNYQ